MKVTNRDRACCMCVRFLLFIISHSDSSSTFFFFILLWALSLCSFLHIFFRVVLLKIKNCDFHLHHESLLFTCLHSLFGLLYVRLAAAVLCAKEDIRRRKMMCIIYYIKLETAKTPKREPRPEQRSTSLLFFSSHDCSTHDGRRIRSSYAGARTYMRLVRSSCWGTRGVGVYGDQLKVDLTSAIHFLSHSLPPSRLGGDQSTRMLLFRFPLLPIPFEHLRFCVCWFNQLIHFPRHK